MVNQGEDITAIMGNTPLYLNGWYSSFLPVLMAVLPLTQGDVLEVGTGMYSTPFLHWYCFKEKRRMVSLENNADFVSLARQYESEKHQVLLAESLGDADIKKPWGVVLIDSFPPDGRAGLIKTLSEYAEYIVVHDAGVGAYDGITKYKFDFEEALPATSILSNFVDVSTIHI